MYFTPPLRLRDIARLRGTAGRTVLKPNTPAGGPLVIIETTSAGDYAIEYPIRQIVEGIRIACLNEYQTGIYINGGVMTLQDVTVVGCGEGLYVSFGVNISVRDSLFREEPCRVRMLSGQGPPAAEYHDRSFLRLPDSRFDAVWGAHWSRARDRVRRLDHLRRQFRDGAAR